MPTNFKLWTTTISLWKNLPPKKKNIGDKKLYVNGLLANTQTHFNQNLTKPHFRSLLPNTELENIPRIEEKKEHLENITLESNVIESQNQRVIVNRELNLVKGEKKREERATQKSIPCSN